MSLGALPHRLDRAVGRFYDHDEIYVIRLQAPAVKKGAPDVRIKMLMLYV